MADPISINRDQDRKVPEKVADDELLVQPTVRVQTTWTPALYRSAVLQADSGQMRLAALLCESLLADDRIAGALEARVKGLMGLPLTFEEGGDQGKKSTEAAEALGVGEDWWQIFPESEQATIISWSILLGFGVGIHRWGWHEDRLVPRTEFWHPQAMKFDALSQQWSTRTASNLTVPVNPGDGVWFMLTPRGVNRPWSTGLWRALAPWYLLKTYAMGDWGRHSEKGSRLVATAPEGSSREQRSDLASELFSAGADAVIALPAGYDLKLVEAMVRGKEMYGALIDAADSAFTIAIRGNNLTTEVQGGSLAAADVHAKVDAAFLRSDAQTWTTAAHEQTLSHWAEINFGDPAVAPWPRYDTTIPEDKKTLAETLNTLAKALESLVNAGVGFDIEQLAERFDLGFLVPGTGKTPDTAQALIEALRAAADAAAQEGAGDGPGQQYADKLEAEMAKHGARSTSALLAQLIPAIRDADSYETAYQAVLDAWDRHPDPVDTTHATEAGLVTGHLGGELEAQEQTAD